MALKEMTCYGAEVGFPGEISIAGALMNKELLVLTNRGKAGVESCLYERAGHQQITLAPGETMDYTLEGWLGVSVQANKSDKITFALVDNAPATPTNDQDDEEED